MNPEDAKTVVDSWGSAHPEWRAFFTPTNAAIIEDWLIRHDKPIVARSLDEAFRELADSGAIISKDGTAPPGKPRPRTASAVTNPETPALQPGLSAAEAEYARFYHANSTRAIKERMKRDDGFKRWLEGQTCAATMHPTGTAQAADPLVPERPKPVFVSWKFRDLGPNAPQQPRFRGGVKVFLPRLQRLVASVDVNQHVLAICDGEAGGLHFSLNDARQLVRELGRQNEPAEIR